MKKQLFTRMLSCLLAAVLIGGEITSVAFAASASEPVMESTVQNTENESTQAVEVPETGAESGEAKDIGMMTEEELEDMAKEAALNVDSLLAETEEKAKEETEEKTEEKSEEKTGGATAAGEGNTYTAVSEGGTTTVEIQEAADGNRNLLFSSDEELIKKDESEVTPVEGYEYVGTGSESGVNIYRQKLKYENLEDYLADSEREDASLQRELDLMNDWLNTPGFTDEEINAALIVAERHANRTRNRYFGEPETEKTVIKRKKTEKSEESDTEEIDGVVFEKVDGESLDPEEAEAMLASPSNAQRRDEKEETEEEKEQDKEQAKEQDKEKAKEQEEKQENRQENKQEKKTSLSTAGEDEKETEEAEKTEETDEIETIVLAPGETLEEEEGYEYEYPESTPAENLVLVTEPEPITTDAVVFREGLTEVAAEGDEEGSGLSTAGVFDGHQTVSAEILILRKDCVYFQINDENGKGINGAAVTLVYRKNSGSKELTVRNLVTASVNGHDGSVYADDMEGDHDCFVDISISGYRTQTYFCSTLKGGVNYKYQLVPANTGDVYLRGAAIDDVDICFAENELTVNTESSADYSIRYLVSVAGETDPAKVPSSVNLRVKPKLPSDGTYKQSDANKYRDRYFKGTEITSGLQAGDRNTATKQFGITAQWSLVYDLADVSHKRPAGGFDDPKKVRLKEDDTVYVELPEGYTWAGTGASATKLNLKVVRAVTSNSWWQNLTFNLSGVTPQGTGASGVQIKSDIPGLKNARLDCSLFNFRLLVTVNPAGYGMVGYNLNGTLKEFYNSLKTQNMLQSRPKVDWKAKSIMQRYQDNKYACFNKCNPVVEKLYNPFEDSRTTGIGSINANIYASIAGVFGYDRQTGYYNMDIMSKIIITGTGEITGYLMLGLVPVFAGVRGVLTGTVEGDVGWKFHSGFTDAAMSNAMKFSLGLQFALTGYAGVGLHGVLCAEVEGGGNIGFVFTPVAASPSSLPFVATGGWNFGYRITVFFMNFSASIFAKQYQLYPDVKLLSGLQGAEEEESGEESEETAISLGSEDCCLTLAGEPEGIATPLTSRGASGERQYMATLSAVDTSSEEYESVLTGEGSTSETKLLKKDIANSKNLQYVETGEDSGVLLRIAYIEEKDKQGVSRVLPRVVASRIGKDGIVAGKEYVLPTSEDDNEAYTEPEILGYDYAFSATADTVDGKQYVYVAVNSGSIDIADTEKLKGKTSEQILETAAADNHLRVVGFNAETGEIVINKFVCKNQISVNGTYIGRDYMYTGTPAVAGHKVDDTFCYWVTSTVSSQYRVNNGVPDGFTYAQWNKDGENYGTVVDGVCRTNIQMTIPKDYETGLNKYNRNKLVSTVADKAVETQKIGTDGKIGYIQPDSGERTAKEVTSVRVDEVWFTTMFGTFQTCKRGEWKYSSMVGNLSHVNNDPLDNLYFTTGNELYQMRNIWPEPKKVNISTEGGEKPQFPEGSDVISYHSVSHSGWRSGNESVLKLLSCYSTQNGTGEDKTTDASVSIMTIRNNVLEGTSVSKIDNRSIVLFTAGFMKDDPADYEAGMRLYYLADATEKEISHIHEEVGIRGVTDLCNVYVWNWKATYGAVLKSLTPLETEVAAEKKVVKFNAVIKNTGPKKAEKVTLSYTTDLNDPTKTRDMTVYFPNDIYPGEEYRKEITIPMEDSWNGWIRIYGAITEVDGHKSADAGFVPVWVNSGDLLGRLNLTAFRTKGGYSVDLSVEGWEKQISTPEHVQLKVYFKHWKGGSDFYWDTAPAHVYSLESVTKESTLYYTCNVEADLANPDFWFRGFYTEGGRQLTDKEQVISDVDFSQTVTAAKFELCGYGDDTWNVVYDTEEVANPMMSNLCWLSLEVDDHKRGSVDGGGYILADGTKTLELKAIPYEGSRVDHWEIKDGGEWVEYTYGVLSEDKSVLTVWPTAGTHSLEFRALFTPDREHNYNWLDVGVSKDEATGADRAQVKVIENGTEKAGRGYGGGLVYCYGLNYKDNYNLIEATYDDKTQLFRGFYYAEIELNSDGTRSVEYVDAYNSSKRSDNYKEVTPATEYQSMELNSALYDSPQLQLMAVLEKQPGKVITFDPGEGRLPVGMSEYALTDENGILPAYLFDEKSSVEKRAIRYGYNFAGWWTEPEGGVQITKENVGSHPFTEDSTLYAHFTVRSGHMMTVRLADEYYGKVSVTRPDAEKPEAVTVYQAKYYDYQIYEIYVEPAEGYEFICQGEGACDVKFYRKKADGTWEEHAPELYRDRDHVWFQYKEDVGDVLIVPQVRKKADSGVNMLRMDGDLLDGVRPAGSYTLTADPAKCSVLGENVYRVAKDLSVTVKAEPVTDEVSFGDWYFYTLDPMGNRVFETEPVSRQPEVTFTVSGDTNIYARWLRKQTLSFAQDTVNVTYGISQPVINPLSGAQTAVTYSLSGTEAGGKTVAAIDPATGAVTVLGAGTVTVNADAAKSEEYGRAHAEYTLTVGRKSLTAPTVHALAGTNSVAVYDGKTKLSDGTDGKEAQYTYTRELVYLSGEKYKVVYTVTGAGSYKDTITADTEKQIELVQFGVAEVSAELEESKRLVAEQAVEKTELVLPEDLDDTLAQTILDDAVKAGLVTDAETKASEKCIIAVMVKAELTELEESTGRFGYKLSTLAGIQLYDGTDVKTVTLPVNAAWFGIAKNVEITIGAGSPVNRVLHCHEDGTAICTYRENTAAAVGTDKTGSFVYDPEKKTVTAVLSCFGDGTEKFTTLQTVNVRNLFVQAVRSEYGTVNVEDGTKDAKVQYAEAYENRTYKVNAFPLEGYTWDKMAADAWTVYTRNAEGLWTENEKLPKPAAKESAEGGLFTMPDTDVLLVANISRTDTAPFLLELDGDREEGQWIGNVDITAEAGKITGYETNKYKVEKDAEVKLTEDHDASRFFIGWFGFCRDVNGRQVIDTEVLSEESTVAFTMTGDGGVYAKWGTWMPQSFSFREASPSVMYGTETYLNEAVDAKTALTWSVSEQQPLSGETVADVNAETGVLTVHNAGTVKVTASAAQEAPWRSCEKSYTLTVTPKPMEERYGVIMLADMQNCVVMDGLKVLVKDTDYTLVIQHLSESLITSYTATGIGNYSGELSATVSQEQKKWVESAAVPEISDSIPESLREHAAELASRVQIEMTSDKVPIEKIKEAVSGTGENQIPPEALKLAADVVIYTVVYATLEAYDPAENSYSYRFDPYAVVALTYKDEYYSAYTPLKEEWYSAERGIRVTAGVDAKPTTIEHVAGDGTKLGTYTAGSNATSTNGKFCYSAADKTVTVCIEHFSSLVITTEPEPEPTPSYESAIGSAASRWHWWKDSEGRWYLEKDGHMYRDEWVYAYNPYAKNEMNQNGYDWFAFDEKGVMRTGWFTDKDGAVYYLWTVSDNTLGRMLYGWQLIEGSWYYFEEKSNGRKGALYKGGYTPDGYFVLPDGKWDGKMILRKDVSI